MVYIDDFMENKVDPCDNSEFSSLDTELAKDLLRTTEKKCKKRGGWVTVNPVPIHRLLRLAQMSKITSIICGFVFPLASLDYSECADKSLRTTEKNAKKGGDG